MNTIDNFLSIVIFAAVTGIVAGFFSMSDMLEFVNRVVINGIIIAFALAIKLPIRWRLKAKQAKTRTNN
ncbi:hypothetical protein [Salinivibrio kushneri]|uniref:hypothetical protein n=1 Tax=Salinivibrio kushneri TaxID=1908198 RepID=UPI0009891A42|nr:hypothetical protein [Salinivibrio kushneri]OOE71704.1 hypothetical protein BZG19_01980 [Salinivibrio kushneri]